MEVKVDSVVQGMGLLVLSVGLTWALYLAIVPPDRHWKQLADSRAPEGRSQATLCHVRGARLSGASPPTLHLEVGFILKSAVGDGERRRRGLIELDSTGCNAIDSCMAQLQIDDPFECHYDATERRVSLPSSKWSPITTPPSQERRAEEADQPATSVVLFLMVSACFCTPLCFLVGAVSLIEGLGFPLPATWRCFDKARCSIGEKLRHAASKREAKREWSV